jgi:hypothetical protein
MSITYTATLPVRDETVLRLSALLHAERLRRGTRQGRRALTCYRQAVLVLRWLLDGTRMSQLAYDNTISKSTGYDNLHEGIAVLAAQAPCLHSALLAAKAAGYDYVLIETDRIATPGPHPRRGSVVVEETQEPRRQYSGCVRPGRLAAVGLPGSSR